MMRAIYSSDPDVKQPEVDVPFGVTDCTALLFATILEEAVMEIAILNNVNTELRLKKLAIDFNYLLTKKYKLALPDEEDELKGIDPRRLDGIEHKLNKLLADRILISKVVLDTYKDLINSKQYTALGKFVLGRIEFEKYCQQLEIDEKLNAAKRHDTYKRLRLQRRYIKKKTIQTDERIQSLSLHLEDDEIEAEVRSRYVSGWQRARTSQLKQTIYDVEITPMRSIEYYKSYMDHEQTVHSNVETYLNVLINDVMKKVEEWMEKYDNDMDAIDLRIQVRKHDYQLAKNKRIDLEEMLEKHDKEMKDWIHFKEEREKARLFREKMLKSAITVQAWWRGLLVRKQLGPYKVKRVKVKKKPAWAD